MMSRSKDLLLHFLLRLLVPVVTLGRLLVDRVSDLLYSLWFQDQHKPLPPIRSPLLLDPATVLAKKIRKGSSTSEQIVSAFILRIRDINPILNCVVDQRFGEALSEAKQIDSLLSKLGSVDKEKLCQDKPFLGVPFTTKDCLPVTGLSWTAGLLKRKGVKADYDAPVITAMKVAGAIPIAITNVSELCMWMESSNPVYGCTNNPYNTSRTVGGSSGGEGCVISSAGSPFGIGSDVGGSIRMPSFFCGIFGHKPSTGVVDNRGGLPKASGLMDKYLVTGPMTRHSEDLLPMLRVLAGAKVDMLDLDRTVDLTSVRYFYIDSDGGFPLISPVHRDLKDAQKRLIKGLEKQLGVKVEQAVLPNFYYSLAIWSQSMAGVNTPSFAAELTELEDNPVNPWLEMIKWIFGLSSHFLPALGLCMAQTLNDTNSEIHKKFVKLGDQLRKELEQVLGNDGVLIYPSHSTPAPYHTQPIVKTFNFAYTAIFNILGNPVTQVPLGLGSWGVPLGVQVVAGLNMDRLSIAVAAEAERLFGGWVPPSIVV